MHEEKRGQKDLVMFHVEVRLRLCLFQPQKKGRFCLSLNCKYVSQQTWVSFNEIILLWKFLLFTGDNLPVTSPCLYQVQGVYITTITMITIIINNNFFGTDCYTIDQHIHAYYWEM